MTRLQRALLSWYIRNGRKTLPWRQTRDPYLILVSEFMLQQTQVDRVIPSYERFVQRFPSFAALAQAPTSDVIRAWKSLGYNTRAVRLKRLAEKVMRDYGGALPQEKEALRTLPGIGEYTAAAVRVFAFERDDLAMDANLRRVMQRIMNGSKVGAPPHRGYEWNSALMDLGALICTARAPSCTVCPVRTDCASAPFDPEQHKRLRSPRRKSAQQRLPFHLTTRFARGRIVDRLRALPQGKRISLLDLCADLIGTLPANSLDLIEPLVKQLESDGIVHRQGDRVALSD